MTDGFARSCQRRGAVVTGRSPSKFGPYAFYEFEHEVVGHANSRTTLSDSSFLCRIIFDGFLSCWSKDFQPARLARRAMPRRFLANVAKGGGLQRGLHGGMCLWLVEGEWHRRIRFIILSLSNPQCGFLVFLFSFLFAEAMKDLMCLRTLITII